jgi:hypothetical protein
MSSAARSEVRVEPIDIYCNIKIKPVGREGGSDSFIVKYDINIL